MGRKPKDYLDHLSDQIEFDDWAEDFADSGDDQLFIEDTLPEFKPTKLSLREWIVAHSPAVVEGGFVFDEVSELIVEECERAVETRGGRLALALSPRAGKTLVMQLLTSWAIAKHNFSVIWVAASSKLAELNTKAVLNIWQHAGYSLHPRARSTKEASIAFRAAGVLSSLSLGASTLGRSAHLLVADDLVGKREFIFSETYREKLKSSWENDILSRLTRKGNLGQSAIVVAQRLSADDHLGMIAAKSAAAAKGGYRDNWRVVEVPYIHPDAGEELEYLNRYPDHWTCRTVPCNGRHGQPTSSRVDLIEVLEKSTAMSPGAWAAMYLCNVEDSGDDGWSSEWIKPVSIKDVQCHVKAVVVDPALIGGKGRDNHGLAVVGLGAPGTRHEGRMVILDAKGLDCPAHELYDHVKAAVIEHKATYLIVEATASGPELIRNCRESELGWYGVNIVPIRPRMNKTARLNASTGIFKNGRVCYLEMSPFIHGLNAQFRSIARGTSNSRKDDTADSVLMAVEHFANLMRSGMQLTPAHWSRASSFRSAYGDTAIWSYGESSVGGFGNNGSYSTDITQPWIGKNSWD